MGSMPRRDEKVGRSKALFVSLDDGVDRLERSWERLYKMGDFAGFVKAKG